MEDLISIIIPVYKVEEYICKCLESIIGQTYKNLEIILVDDGSPDRSGEICEEYAKKDKRIKVIHKKNGGQSEARNLGLSIATGQYIGFVDSDDFIKNNMFETLHKNMIQYKADITVCNIIREGKSIENYGNLEIYERNEMLRELLKDHITNYIYNKLYRKELWKDIRFPVGRLLEDMDVMYHIIEKANKIVCTSKTEYYYCVRKDSSISKIDTKVTMDLKTIVNKRYKYLQETREDILELLNFTRMFNIIQYHDNLSYCKEYKVYNSEEFKTEYEFYRKNYKKYKRQMCQGKSSRKKFEIFLLYLNRNLYYCYGIIRTDLKNKFKKEE